MWVLLALELKAIWATWSYASAMHIENMDDILIVCGLNGKWPLCEAGMFTLAMKTFLAKNLLARLWSVWRLIFLTVTFPIASPAERIWCHVSQLQFGRAKATNINLAHFTLKFWAPNHRHFPKKILVLIYSYKLASDISNPVNACPHNFAWWNQTASSREIWIFLVPQLPTWSTSNDGYVPSSHSLDNSPIPCGVISCSTTSQMTCQNIFSLFISWKGFVWAGMPIGLCLTWLCWSSSTWTANGGLIELASSSSGGFPAPVIPRAHPAGSPSTPEYFLMISGCMPSHSSLYMPCFAYPRSRRSLYGPTLITLKINRVDLLTCGLLLFVLGPLMGCAFHSYWNCSQSSLIWSKNKQWSNHKWLSLITPRWWSLSRQEKNAFQQCANWVPTSTHSLSIHVFWVDLTAM